MKKTSTSRYTYSEFAKDVIALADGEIEMTEALASKVREKAVALLATQEAKALYNASHPRKNAAKGASSETQAKATAISTVLTHEPMTTSDINTALGTDFTALQVANAVKFIAGAQSTKMVRTTTNAKGLKQEKEYTAYFMG